MKPSYLVVFSHGFTHEFENVDIDFVKETSLQFCEARGCTAKIYELKSSIKSKPVSNELLANLKKETSKFHTN